MAFDHMFDHFAKNSLISYPGVAQLVGRLIWEPSDPIFPVNEPIRKPVSAPVLFSLDLPQSVV